MPDKNFICHSLSVKIGFKGSKSDSIQPADGGFTSDDPSSQTDCLLASPV